MTDDRELRNQLARITSQLDRAYVQAGSEHMGDITELCLPNHPGFRGDRPFTERERQVLAMCASIVIWELTKSMFTRRLDEST